MSHHRRKPLPTSGIRLQHAIVRSPDFEASGTEQADQSEVFYESIGPATYIIAPKFANGCSPSGIAMLKLLFAYLRRTPKRRGKSHSDMHRPTLTRRRDRGRDVGKRHL
jgi:hypothetical protein